MGFLDQYLAGLYSDPSAPQFNPAAPPPMPGMLNGAQPAPPQDVAFPSPLQSRGMLPIDYSGDPNAAIPQASPFDAPGIRGVPFQPTPAAPANPFDGPSAPFAFAGPQGQPSTVGAAPVPAPNAFAQNNPAVPAIAPQGQFGAASPAPGLPVAAGGTQAAAASDEAAAPVRVGNVMMPRAGAADDYEPEDTPAGSSTDVSAQRRAPMSFGGSSAGPDFGDRTSMAARGFLGNMSGGPVTALIAGLGSLISGKPSDPYSIKQSALGQATNATAQALLKAGAPVEAIQAAAAQAAAGNGAPLTDMFKQYYGPDKYQHVTVKDADGNELPLSFDQSTGKYQLSNVISHLTAAGGGSIQGPNGPIAVPAGLTGSALKEFKNHVAATMADAATGKKTEAQAKASSFAARMEQADSVMPALQNEGLSGYNAAAGAIPGVGNAMLSTNAQKYNQAKSAFITALLRQESGAAINKNEFTRYEKEMFPQFGDAPEVVAQKAAMRRAAIAQMRGATGPGYQSPGPLPGGAQSSGVTPNGINWSVQ